MAADLANDKFWVNKSVYHDSEKSYHEGLAKDGMGTANVTKEPCIKSSLSMEVAKARELIKTSMQRVGGITTLAANDKSSTCNMNNAGMSRLTSAMEKLENCIKNLEKRVESLELKFNTTENVAVCPPKPSDPKQTSKVKPEDDDIDLFGSDSDEESEEAKKVREQRLAEYAAKKSKKSTSIAKSNIILDIKPWNDETDMKLLEEAVRNVKMDGLVWGASKLVPLVFGIYKLQISCVVEDDKVSVDQLVEVLEDMKEYTQSIDIAAFNKV